MDFDKRTFGKAVLVFWVVVLTILFFVLCLPANSADLDHGFGVDLYGRSYHHDLPAGERDKLNEANIGFALRSTVYKEKHSFSIDAGAFMNSYYDPAYWVGAEYRYRLFKHFEPGLMLRHWESETYPDKAINKYLTVTIPWTEDVRTTFIVRSSGYIVFVTFPIGGK